MRLAVIEEGWFGKDPTGIVVMAGGMVAIALTLIDLKDTSRPEIGIDRFAALLTGCFMVALTALSHLHDVAI